MLRGMHQRPDKKRRLAAMSQSFFVEYLLYGIFLPFLISR